MSEQPESDQPESGEGDTSIRRVTIQQRRLVRYRVTLFEQLRATLAERGVELRVVYGQASPSDAKRNDDGHLQWGDEVAARWFTIRGMELVWQPMPSDARNCDLLILTQENKILSNHRFQLLRPFTRRRVGFWGHGRDLQSKRPDGLSARFKRLLLTKVDWWFAYTEHTRRILLEDGFDDSRITVLDNAIDNDAFTTDLEAVTDDMLGRLRKRIDLAPEAPLGLYCGSLYTDKRIDLLLEVAERVHTKHPSFRLVVIGDGPSRPEVEAFAAERPWVHWVGVQQGIDKAAWFRLATVYLSPGAVGLHVLDAFAAGIPMFTTTTAKHGPEICYLEDGVNGFVLEPDAAGFAATVCEVLDEPDRLRSLVEQGRNAAERYTLANMVERFADGIEAALNHRN